MNIVKQLFKDMRKGENITWLAIVVLLVVTLVLNALGLMSNSVLASITLSMLALLATNVLFVKYRIEEILGISKVIDPASTVQLLDDFPALLEHYLRNSNEIWMVGISLRKTTHGHYDDFLSRLPRGLRIRGLLINPYSQNVKMDVVAQGFSRRDPPKAFASDYDVILQRYKLLRDEATDKDQVRIGLLDFIPTVSLYIFPREKEGGIIFVQLYSYGAPIGSTPYFVVTQKQHPIWYEHFRDLYEGMWKNCIDYFETSY
jgi:hypothetical protein